MDSVRREEDSVEFRAVLRLGGQEVGPRRVDLLAAIENTGSISKAAAAIGMTYKGAWDAVDALNNLSERPLVLVQHGGRGGGGAALTEFGKRLLAEFRRLRGVEGALPNVSLSEAGRTEISAGELSEFLARLQLRVSARNVLVGIIGDVRFGPVNCSVSLEIGPEETLHAVITSESAQDLDLEPGRSAFALIKASWIVLSVPDGPKTSARNQLRGVIERLHEGAINCEVVVALPGGRRLAAVVTTDSARALHLETGQAVCALIKASSVIVGVLP